MNKKSERREDLTAAILSDVEIVVRQELADSPTSICAADRQAIESEIIDHTRGLLEALSPEEMANQGALILHLANARTEAQRLIRDRRFEAENAKCKMTFLILPH
jgi:hypothetical protein